MNVDPELESWRHEWQAQSAVTGDLRAQVERETRAMRRAVLGEIFVTLVFCGGALAWAALSRRADALVLAVGVCLFAAMAWAISFLMRRDAWVPATLTTSAFLDLSILRCRRRREALVAECVLYAIILAFNLGWIYYNRPDSPSVAAFLASGGVAWVWVVTAVLGVAALRWRAKLSRELDTLTNLRQRLGTSSL